MPLSPVLLLVALVGALLTVASVLALRVIGARPSLARRLAGPPQLKVGRLLDAGGPRPPVARVAGRIRCREPLQAAGGERLVAFHRDVEVEVGGRWRTVERLRETRSFELWDHEGSLTVDPSLAAEPLVSIPRVWRGDPSELEEPHASAVARLVEQHGPATAARATTRTINVTDDLLVLARPVVTEDGRVRLEPPEGGFVIATLALDDAMRLLGGRHRRTAAAAVIGIGLGVALIAIGVVGATAAALLSG
jgi:hypothetical protein